MVKSVIANPPRYMNCKSVQKVMFKRAETSVGIFTAASATMKASFKPYTTASRSRRG